MMGSAQTVLELVATAQATAKVSDDHIAEILRLLDTQGGTDAHVDELRAATVALETVAIDLFSVFEARMQHHFRRGPFSRKLRSLLIEAGQTDLADGFHQYYLAVNVLKHGKGASYRELLNATDTFIVLNSAAEHVAEQPAPAPGLVDVREQGFIDGLSATLVEAYHFLEKK